MARYTAAQIYSFARQAGFTPDQSATMTAIALAESGGDTHSHNTQGEDSRGLWQINARAHPDLGQAFDLYDPAQNARAAFQVSHGGADVSPWTTTHGGLAASYLKFQDEAQAAAVGYGDGQGLGVWTGTPGYGHELAAGSAPGRAATPAHGSPDGSEAVVVAHNAPLLGTATAGTGRPGEAFGIPVDEPDPRHGAEYGIPLEPGVDPAASADPTATGPDATVVGAESSASAGTDRVHAFLAAATAQTGDRYVFGAEARLDDPDPDAFDCSELVQWAAHQAGVDVVDNAWMQYRQMHDSGTIIPVEQAVHTPGALLFSFSGDPDGRSAPVHQHVAISLGNGRTIEALGEQYGVGSFEASAKRFQYAAVIPGMSQPAPAPAPHVDPVGIVIPPPGHPTEPPHPGPPLDEPPDDLEHRLTHDPDHLDLPDPAADDTADPADPAADHPDQLATADVDHDGLDDSLAQAVLWSGTHPAGDDASGPEAWSHAGHDDPPGH